MASDVALYPVTLLVEGRPCLVVGGGPVGARKAAGLVGCGARVTMVAPDFGPDAVALAESEGAGYPVTLERRAYLDGEAGHYRLVITATGIAEIDGAVSADAEAAGVWVNSADDAAHCTFYLPSVHRDGPVSIAVSTAGTSPALATWLRHRVGADLGPGLGILAALLDEARQRLKAGGRSTEVIDWRGLLDGPLPELVRAGRLDEARALLAAATAAPPVP